jgi:hypothetical protein
VHGDVFRPPKYLEVLAALIGTGVQLALLVLSVILITIAGKMLLSIITAHRGGCALAPANTDCQMGVLTAICCRYCCAKTLCC